MMLQYSRLILAPLLLIIISTTYIQSQVHNDNICSKAKCSSFNCGLPACLCADTNPPKGIDKVLVPQFILFTFNDVVKKETYQPLTKVFTSNRRNPSGLKITSTLFISDRDGNKKSVSTDYCLVQRLYEHGHELASHSISHKSPADFWRSKASLREWADELDGMRQNLTDLAKLDENHVQGARAPFLVPGGDLQFRAMSVSEGIKYDSSLILKSPVDNGGYWPFTLDFNKDLECTGTNGICPVNCYRNLWEVPMHILEGPNGVQCTRLDFCLADKDANTIYSTLMGNYHARRNGNRSPLVLSISLGWFERNENAVEGLAKFLDRILEEDDTFVVSISQMLQWMKKPVPIDRLNEIPALYPGGLGDRPKAFCNTKRGTGGQSSFFINGNTMVILEVVVLTVVLLYLIAKDME